MIAINRYAHYLKYKINQAFFATINLAFKIYCRFDKNGEEKWKNFTKMEHTCIRCKCKYRMNRWRRKKNYAKWFCSKKCKRISDQERYQAFKHNARCKFHPLQTLTYKNECWSCYRESFEGLHSIKSLRHYPFKWRLALLGFRPYPTFRTSMTAWNGDKIAFEQNLVDSNVGWFVYIKFYVNKAGRIKPIVAGKSGSSLVNASGSDLNFSTSVKDGPSRKFISYNGFTWYYDHILVKKCKSEIAAYALESKIIRQFDLFGS